MARSLLDALVAGRAGLRHIPGERQGEAAAALAGPACDLGVFVLRSVEPFASATVDHVLAGSSEGIQVRPGRAAALQP